MKHSYLLIACSTLIAVPCIAQSTAGSTATVTSSASAAAPVDVQPNAMIISADGHRIGRVDHVRSVNGTPVAASVVIAGQFVDVPISSLTSADGRLVSSMKASEIVKR